jgi:hypothetical protein
LGKLGKRELIAIGVVDEVVEELAHSHRRL